MHRSFRSAAATAVAFALAAGARAGTVATDNSLAHAGPVPHVGNTFTVAEPLGRRVGSNLFFSLSQLNLDQGETADFAPGSSGLTHILTRVTGGASTINGTLRSTAPGATFLLINPSGVVFGPSASLDVAGSFAVTTADVVKLADGRTFTAAPGASDATLSTAAPSAFGFLAATPAGVTVNASTLQVPSSKTLSVVGGDASIGGLLVAPEGRITVASVASPGTVTLDPSAANAKPQLSGFTTRGNLTLAAPGGIRTDGPGGGQIVIRAGKLTATNADLSAQTLGADNGVGIDVGLTDALTLTGSSINASTQGAGAAGNVTVKSASIFIDGQNLGTNPGLLSRSTTAGSGAGGNVTVNTGSFTAVNNGGASTATFGTGAGGNLTINADSLTLTNGAFISTNASQSGAGGSIDATVGSLTITSLGAIQAGAFGTGNGGNVQITTSGPAVIDGQGTNGFTGISVQSGEPGPNGRPITGKGGNLSLSAASLRVVAGGVLDAATFGSGRGGDVTLSIAGAAAINGAGTNAQRVTAVVTQTGSSLASAGAGGNVTISAGSLTVKNAILTSSTTGPAQGGNIAVDVAGGVSISGSRAGIFADSTQTTPGAGPAGSVRLKANSLTVSDGAAFESRALGPGLGGNLSAQIQGALTVDGTGFNGFTGIDCQTGSAGATMTEQTGRGGSIHLTAGSMALIGGGEVEVDTFGTGRGGDIIASISGPVAIDGTANPQRLTGLTAETHAGVGGGNGGNIMLSAGSLSILRAIIEANTLGTGTGGDVVLNVTGPATFDGDGFASVGVSAQTEFLQNGAGHGGSIRLTAGSLIVQNNATVTADTLGPGAAGDVSVTITNGGLTVLNAGAIASDTLSTGRGGNVSVAVKGALLVNGQDDPTDSTGISADSDSGGPRSGAAGSVNVSAASVRVVDRGFISSDTSGGGAGGNVSVSATGLIAVNGTGDTTVNTGIAADSNPLNVSVPAGPAGSVFVSAGSLRVSHTGFITSDAFGTGAGGNVNVFVSGLGIVDGAGDSGGNTGIAANSFLDAAGSGAAGSVNVTAGSLSLLNGGFITGSTNGTGAAGPVNVVVPGALVLDGTHSPGILGGIASETFFTGPLGGSGGDVTVSAGSLSTFDATISANTFGTGRGGNVTVHVAGPATIDGGGASTGLAAQSELLKIAGGGPAGDITLSAMSLDVRNGGTLTSDTFGTGRGGNVTVNVAGPITMAGTPGHLTGAGAGTNFAGLGAGAGGDVRINAQSLLMDSGEIEARASGFGRAGSVEIQTSGSVTLRNGSALRVNAAANNGGMVQINAGGNIELFDSKIPTRATFNGGSVNLLTGGIVLLDRSSSIAQAGINGGSITIDPSLVVLTNSRLSADAILGTGGAINILATSGFLQFASPITFSSTFGVQGTLTLHTPDQDVSSSLVALPTVFPGSGAGLIPTCLEQADSDESSFVQTGAGGLPPQPAGWLPNSISNSNQEDTKARSTAGVPH